MCFVVFSGATHNMSFALQVSNYIKTLTFFVINQL